MAVAQGCAVPYAVAVALNREGRVSVLGAEL